MKYNELKTLPILVGPSGTVATAAEYKADFRDRMHQFSITQRNLCDFMGTDHSRISKWLRPNHDIRLSTIATMERALHGVLAQRSNA